MTFYHTLYMHTYWHTRCMFDFIFGRGKINYNGVELILTRLMVLK